jgi:hypothetical protein
MRIHPQAAWSLLLLLLCCFGIIAPATPACEV